MWTGVGVSGNRTTPCTTDRDGEFEEIPRSSRPELPLRPVGMDQRTRQTFSFRDSETHQLHPVPYGGRFPSSARRCVVLRKDSSLIPRAKCPGRDRSLVRKRERRWGFGRIVRGLDQCSYSFRPEIYRWRLVTTDRMKSRLVRSDSGSFH